MAETIGGHAVRCLAAFRGLVDPAKVLQLSFPEPWIPRKLQDEHSRFKVWAGNLGAHKTGTGSLDYRLRDASRIRSQIISLLEELCDLLQQATAIASGEKIPWDQLEDEDPLEDDDTDSPGTELGQIAIEGVADVVDCLLRLSRTIRNPAPHDRYAKSQTAETSHFEPFDIQHVQSKFPTIELWLAERLGKGISRRRQYLRYRESHHSKLSHGLDDPEDTNGECNETIASSIPLHLKDNVVATTILEDDRSDAGASQTSYASTSMGDPEALRIPPLPEEAHRGPFQCCFCYMIIVAATRAAWKKHVFSDLQPYVCLEKDCPTAGQEFSQRNEWMSHVRDNHWDVYTCLFGCSSTFRSSSECRDHLTRAHPGSLPTDDLDALVKLAAQPLEIKDGIPCPICGDNETLRSEKQYRKHVSRHQEQLSLFALPRTSADEEGGTESDSTIEDEGGGTVAEDPLVDPGREDSEAASFSGSSDASHPQRHDQIVDELLKLGRDESAVSGNQGEAEEDAFVEGERHVREPIAKLVGERENSGLIALEMINKGLEEDGGKRPAEEAGEIRSREIALETTRRELEEYRAEWLAKEAGGRQSVYDELEDIKEYEEVLRAKLRAEAAMEKGVAEDHYKSTTSGEQGDLERGRREGMLGEERGPAEFQVEGEIRGGLRDRSRSPGLLPRTLLREEISKYDAGAEREDAGMQPHEGAEQAEGFAVKEPQLAQTEARLGIHQRRDEDEVRHGRSRDEDEVVTLQGEELWRREQLIEEEAEYLKAKAELERRIRVGEEARRDKAYETEAKAKAALAELERVHTKKNEEEEGERIRRELELKKLEEEKKAQEEAQRREKEAEESIAAYKAKEAERIEKERKEEEVRKKEFQRLLHERLISSGLDESDVEMIIRKENEKRKKEDDEEKEDAAKQAQPTYTRMSLQHVELETLKFYKMDWEACPDDPNKVIIKRWVPEREQALLWNHTRQLRKMNSKVVDHQNR